MIDKHVFSDESKRNLILGLFPLIKSLSLFESKENISSNTIKDIKDDLFDQTVVETTNLFMKIKSVKPHFTLFKNKDLEKIRLDDDTSSLSETDQGKLDSFLRSSDNLIGIFHFLLSYSIFPSRSYSEQVAFINYVETKSVFCKDPVGLYVLCSKKEIFVIMKNEFLDIIPIEEYISQCIYPHSEDFVSPFRNNFCELTELVKSNSPYKEIQKKLNCVFDEISKEVGSQHKFLSGAISFFDFLGWKGIWQNASNENEPLAEVTGLIENISNELKISTLNLLKSFDPEIGEKLSVLISISDTIAIFTPKIPNVSEKDLIILHSDIARKVLEWTGKKGYPIRGAINFGEYRTLNNIMIGPGIDECAGWHESCDWIGVHLTPSAQFEWENSNCLNNDEQKSCQIIEYSNIPLKAGKGLKYCIKWSLSYEEFNNLRKRSKAIMPEVAAKYLNTYNFLGYCRKEADTNGKR